MFFDKVCHKKHPHRTAVGEFHGRSDGRCNDAATFRGPNTWRSKDGDVGDVTWTTRGIIPLILISKFFLSYHSVLNSTAVVKTYSCIAELAATIIYARQQVDPRLDTRMCDGMYCADRGGVRTGWAWIQRWDPWEYTWELRDGDLGHEGTGWSIRRNFQFTGLPVMVQEPCCQGPHPDMGGI
jgi:hypothetical protein